MHRIGGRRRSSDFGCCRADVGIPLLCYWGSNLWPGSGTGTVLDGQFDWGGRLQKSNGGVQRFPQNGWKPFEEYKGRREPDCETDRSSRDESRA